MFDDAGFVLSSAGGVVLGKFSGSALLVLPKAGTGGYVLFEQGAKAIGSNAQRGTAPENFGNSCAIIWSDEGLLAGIDNSSSRSK